MSTKLTDVSLIWGSPGDIEMVSDGGGEYASVFRLTPRGAAKIAKALGADRFRDAEHCGHEFPDEGDAIHVAGEPVEMICLASPLWPAAEVRSTDTTESGVESLPEPCSDECGWCGENMPPDINERGE